MNCQEIKYDETGECKESLITPRNKTSVNYQAGVQYKKLSEQAKQLKQPWQFLKFDILSILAFNRFDLETK
jgi:hypothetical protein